MTWKYKAKKYGPACVWYGCGIGASLAYIYPHTLGLEKYKEAITETSEGKPVELDSEIAVVAQEIKNHFKWRQSSLFKRPDFDFVQTTQPLDFVQRGSVTSRWGAVIGVPILFTTSSLQAARESPVTVLQKYNINVTEDEGTNILEFFTLSPAAKKFALAREMYLADSFYIFASVIAINLAFFSTYAVGAGLSNVLSLFLPGPGAVLISFLSLIPALGYGCIKFHDWYTRVMLAKSDKEAAFMDSEVAAGGIEYYSTLIARKQVQGNVSSSVDTESLFDMKWRKKELSFEERKQRLEKALEKLSS
ncbi:unnamed protein product [Candidula unifasciata]|uniref:Uncharacterized protein n=1 Tax=Candidula unifasciata TaxID=100452 RepID=A0A8S3ZQ95_9EUPU|nr:unnamed protein product [Candidula unifasciata]